MTARVGFACPPTRVGHWLACGQARRPNTPITTDDIFCTPFREPDNPTDWRFLGAYTKPKCEITFPNSVAGGSQVWVCAAWVNHKMEAGPVSVPVMTNLQGGGVGGAGNMKIAA